RKVCFMNRPAHERVENCPKSALSLANMAGSAKCTTGFVAWLDTLPTQADDCEVSSSSLFCDEGECELRIVGCHLGNEKTARPQLALFVTQSGKVPPISPELLAAIFGFTPTESLVATALAKGERPAEISVSLNIAQTTVAFHMRNIFQKTGVSRQASLVVLLLTSPISIL